MKQNYLLLFFTFFCVQFYAQSIKIDGPTSVEVGVPTNFNFSFQPNYPQGAVSYHIEFWTIEVTHNSGSSEVPGHINNFNSTSTTISNVPGSLTIPIQWGDVGNIQTDLIKARASGIYLNQNNVQVGTFSTSLFANSKSISIRRICLPSISHTQTFNCSQETIQITADNFCYGNIFAWSLSGGEIVENYGSMIKIKPPQSGGFNVSVEVKRSQSHINYKQTRTVTINRTSRSATYELIHNNTTTPTYICKGTGQTFAIADHPDITGIVWNAQNSSISNEIISNGKRTVIITPSSSVNNGSSISINATVNYNGGCSTTTPSRTFTIFENETPPSPQGYVYMEPLPYGSSVCDAQGFEVIFNATNPYVNGNMTFSPTVLPPHALNGPITVTACYTNRCSGIQTCTSFQTSPPSPCNFIYSTMDATVSPNPTGGKIYIKGGNKQLDGYAIYNENGQEVQRGKLRLSEEGLIELDKKLISGKYFLIMFGPDGSTTKQIILKK